MSSTDPMRPEGEKLRPTQLQHAEYLQRQGLTLTEIAATLSIDRGVIVDALYSGRVLDLVAPEPELVPERLAYAGAGR
jgi:hypothetical protein